MKTILVICPTKRTEDFLQTVSGQYRFIFDELSISEFDEALVNPDKATHLLDWQLILDTLLKRYEQIKIDGVISTSDYPGSLIAGYLAQHWNLIGPSLTSLLIAHHKYYSRLHQQRFVWQAVPQFALIGAGNERELYNFQMPFFLKPVKSCSSVHARIINSQDDLEQHINHLFMPQPFLAPINYFMDAYTSWRYNANYLLAEAFLHGKQVTLEGFAVDGRIHCFGIVDSIMYPGTISFKRFEYPSTLPSHVQREMESISQKIMRAIGFNNGMFNIEFMYDERIEKTWIIEINPRIACQFQPLYRIVDGINSYQLLVDIAVGKKPRLMKQESRGHAAINVLRTFEDKMVVDIPSPKEIQHIYQKYPECYIEIFAQKGKKLSELRQDEGSYRYGTITLGGKNKPDIEAKLEYCQKNLSFNLV